MNVRASPKYPTVRLPQEDEEVAVLMDDVTVSVNGVTFVIPKGFGTDGASIPRLLWRICGHPLETPRIYAALVHDYLYSGRTNLTRLEADDVYRKLLKNYGIPAWRAWIEWKCIRLFGASHFDGFVNN